MEITSSLSSINLIFHISMLRKCIGDPSQIIPVKDIDISNFLSFKEIPIEILNFQVYWLRTKDVAFVKVLWRNHKMEETT